MKDLRGQATGTVLADPRRCFALLLAVDSYPHAYPDVIRHVEVLERAPDGSPRIAQAVVRVSVGPIERDFELTVKVAAEGNRLVRLTRLPNDRSDRERVTLTWHISPGPPTRLAVKVRARLDIPRVIPVQGAGGTVARGLLQAACEALEARASAAGQNGSRQTAARARGSRTMASARSS